MKVSLITKMTLLSLISNSILALNIPINNVECAAEASYRIVDTTNPNKVEGNVIKIGETKTITVNPKNGKFGKNILINSTFNNKQYVLQLLLDENLICSTFDNKCRKYNYSDFDNESQAFGTFGLFICHDLDVDSAMKKTALKATTQKYVESSTSYMTVSVPLPITDDKPI